MSTSTPKKKRDGAYRHGDLRRALTVAARRMLEERGPEMLSLRELAREANVSHSAPYRHFPDRASLLAAVVESGFAEFAKALEAPDSSLPAADRLVEMGVAYVIFALANPQTFRLMFGGSPLAGGASETAKRGFALLENQVAASVTDRPLGVHIVAAWAIVHGLAFLLLDKKVDAPEDGAEELARFVREVLRAKFALAR